MVFLQSSDSWFGRREPWRLRHCAGHHATHRGARGRRSCRTVTLRCHYYLLMSSWVKTLTVPESPSPGLYNQALVGGISMNATPLTRIVNLSLDGGST